MKINTRCDDDAVAGFNKARLTKAATARLLGTDTVRADTTVMPAAVSYPTDSGLWAAVVLTTTTHPGHPARGLAGGQ